MTDTTNNEADDLIRALGFEPERFRTECGFINHHKLAAAIQHPDDYAGLAMKAAPQPPAPEPQSAIAAFAVLDRHVADLRASSLASRSDIRFSAVADELAKAADEVDAAINILRTEPQALESRAQVPEGHVLMPKIPTSDLLRATMLPHTANEKISLSVKSYAAMIQAQLAKEPKP